MTDTTENTRWTCKECGKENDTAFGYCIFCGAEAQMEEKPLVDEAPIEETTEEEELVDDKPVKSRPKRVCPECGTALKDHMVFCPKCGTKVNAAGEQEIEQKPQKQKTRKKQKTSKRPKAPKRSNGPDVKKARVIKIVLLAVIAACVAAAAVYYLTGPGHKEKTIATDGIRIVDCFADVNSAYHDEKYGTYKVNLIMLIENGSTEDIAGMVFQMKDKDGNSVMNALDVQADFRADGYIKHGEQGIMAAPIWVNDLEKATSAESIAFTGAYPFEGGENYVMPKGEITGAKGVNKDHYTVKISNSNRTEISTSAVFAAVRLKDGKIDDADATGRIKESIPAGAGVVEIEEVFQDPSLAHSYKKYTVYVIDPQNYREGGNDAAHGQQ